MTRPNILFLLPDQLRQDFLGCYGATWLRTPSIDALAAEATVFDDAISPHPICVPARAAMLTGLDAIANGVLDNLSWLRPDRREMGIETWPEALAAVGYHTAAIGKMHFYPWDAAEGFAERVIAEDKRHIHVEDDYFEHLRARGLARLHGDRQRGYVKNRGASFNDLPVEDQPDQWVGAQTRAFLRRQEGAGRPWALMVGFPGPHDPYDPPEEAVAHLSLHAMPEPRAPTSETERLRPDFLARYRADWARLDYADVTADQVARARLHYAALVEALDREVGLILAELDAADAADRTAVVFASDHGDYLGDYGLFGKTFFHEPSVHVPLMIRGGGFHSCRRADPVALTDLFPTLLEIGGAEIRRPISGGPLSAASDAGRVIVGATDHGFMARDADWKLARYADGGTSLYNLAEDPGERRDLSEDPVAATQRARLDSALQRSVAESLRTAHADKRVPDARAAPPHPFYARGWSRPYPAASRRGI